MSEINQPVTPGVGPEGLPTPALPDINQPVTPGVGPEGLPTPALPSPPQTGGTRQCPTGYRAAVVSNNQTFTDLLIANDVSFNALRLANPSLPTTRLSPGTFYCVPPVGSRRLCGVNTVSYVVGQNENLTTLSQAYQVAPERLLRANPCLAPSDFIPGRVICLP